VSKDIGVFITHMLESISLIENYTADIGKERFLKSSQIQDAVIRRLEIIGEAARNMPDDFKEKHSDIPWREITGLRNILIHEYFGIDLELTWTTVKNSLPELKQKLTIISEV
jgi:uncharacterized protein with HEPN domain